MASLDDAVNQVHDIILKSFGAAGGSSTDVVVAFEYGSPFNPAEVHGSPDSPALATLRAMELMSGMANVVPHLHDKFFERGARTVDNQYEILLKGSQPSGAAGLDVFAAIKASAATAFEEVQQSVDGPHQYHAVTSNPSNWFDPAVAENWSHFRVTTVEPSADALPAPGPAPGPAPAPAQASSPGERPRLDASGGPPGGARRPADAPLDPRLTRFRIMPLRPVDIPPSIQTHLLQLAAASEPSQPAPRVTSTRTFKADVIDVSQHEAVVVEFWANWCGPCRVLTPKLQSALQAAKTSIQWVRIDVDQDAVQSFVATTTIPTLVAFMNGRESKRLVGPPDDARLAAFIQSIDDTFVPSGSNRMQIDFDMCIVQLGRRWLSDGFLSVRGWFVPGFRKGEFSDGASIDDPGNLNAIPIACVLIRNLVVNAQWTTADVSALDGAANLGPFSLRGHAFDQHAGTLTVSGMQSIAWVCAKMPLLPPDDAPPPAPA